MAETGFTTMAGAKASALHPEIAVGMLGYAFMARLTPTLTKKTALHIIRPGGESRVDRICGRNEEAAKKPHCATATKATTRLEADVRTIASSSSTMAAQTTRTPSLFVRVARASISAALADTCDLRDRPCARHRRKQAAVRVLDPA